MSPDSSDVSNSSWLFEEKTRWTPAENKAFENALAVFDKDTPHRWQRVAEMVPGKTVLDVIKQYKELEDDVSSIEAGRFPFPGYEIETSPFTLEWGNRQDFNGFKKYSHEMTGKRSSSTRPSEQDRKKGIPWTEEEHRLFLMGLNKYGKGDWRNISRSFVITRTPTQVASHAQKYFIRQLSSGKDKRRASIHDITTSSINDSQMPSADNDSQMPSADIGSTPSPQQYSTVFPHYSTVFPQQSGDRVFPHYSTVFPQQSDSITVHQIPYPWSRGSNVGSTPSPQHYSTVLPQQSDSITVHQIPYPWSRGSNGTMMNFSSGGGHENMLLYMHI